MVVEILTGSGEFFPTKKDTDYVCFREQEQFFVYYREHGYPVATDRFCYREGITKQELWQWHRKENGWWLNFAPLVTKGYLEHLGIDLFGEDREPAYQLMHKVFCSHYRIPHQRKKYGKCLYRVYVYTCFMKNGTLELTAEQRDHAYDIYRHRYNDPAVIRGIYEFFKVDPEEIEIGMRMVFGEEEEDEDDNG